MGVTCCGLKKLRSWWVIIFRRLFSFAVSHISASLSLQPPALFFEVVLPLLEVEKTRWVQNLIFFFVNHPCIFLTILYLHYKKLACLQSPHQVRRAIWWVSNLVHFFSLLHHLIFLLTFLQNFYQNMMDARDPNDASKTMFKVLQISLACPACMEAGRASECTHMEKFRPPWSKL